MNKIRKFIVLALLFCSSVIVGQTYNMSNGTVNTCSGTFYDSGGSGGSYGANQNITQTFCSNNGQPIYLIFTTFNVENGWEDLYIYDGPSTASPMFNGGVSYTGTTSPGTVTATGTCITIVFTSDGSVENAGWAASIGCGTPPPPPPPPPGSDCSVPNPFCGDTPVIYPAGTGTTAPAGPYYDCLGSQPNPAWFSIEVATTGPMNFSISAGSDIDFIIWGPFPNLTGLCYGALTAGNVVDCSYSGTANETAVIPNAVVGENYMVLITNFSGVAQNITFSQTNFGQGGAGSGNCNLLCNITNMTGTPGACQGATNTFDVTGTINTTYPPAGGTLTISSSCGGSPLVLNPPFATTYNYTLTGIPAGSGTCTLTASYSADATCTRTVTVTSPASCTACNVTVANNGPVCPGSTINLTSNGTITSGGPLTYSWTGPNGFTSTAQNPSIANATLANDGIYTVTASSGTVTCSNTTAVTVSPTPTLSVNSATICDGISTTLTVSGGTGYSWAPATGLSATTGSSVTANPTTTTIYTVTNTACPATATSTVTVNPIPVITVNSPTICEGDNTLLTASGATTYSWSPGTALSATTGASVFSNPVSTTVYTVSGTSSGCTGTGTSTVTVNPLPILTVNSATICPASSATLTATGATTYSWTPSVDLSASTGASVVSTPANTTVYSVTGTTSGCSSTQTCTVTIDSNPVIAVNSDSICDGSSTVITATGASGYSWSPSTGLSSTTGASVTANPTTTTIYTVTGNTNGCIGTGTSTITVLAIPVITVNSPTICIGDNSTLNASGATSYIWSPGTGLNITNGSSVIANPTTTTVYQIFGTDANGCLNNTTATVTVNPLPNVNAGVNDTVCLGSSVLLNASGAVSYVWNNDPALSSTTISNPNATPTVTNTYFVTGTDINGCVNTDNVTLIVPPTFSLTLSSTPALCFGSSDGTASTLVNPGTGPFANYSYLWNTGSTLPQLSGLNAGTYNVVVRDLASCLQTASIIITEPSALIVGQGTNTPVTCNGGNDGSALLNVSGATPAYSYLWQPSGLTTSNLSGASAGTHSVTVTDINGCNVTVPVIITEPMPLVLASPNDQTICLSTSSTLVTSTTGGNGGASISWADGSSTQTGSSITVSPGTTTSYTISATDALGCASINQPVVSVIVLPSLSINSISDGVICATKELTKDVTGNGGNGNHYYTWAPFNGVTLLNASGSSVELDPLTTITYTVTLYDNCGTPTDDTTFVLTVNPTPTVTITPPVTSGCQPLMVSFTGNSNPGTASCFWSLGGVSTSANCSPTQVFSQAGSYTITYNVVDINGCENSTSSSVVVYPLPQAAFVASPQPTTIIDPVVTFTDITFGNVTEHTWLFNDSINTNSTLETPSYTYLTAGEYPVTLAVVSDKGCVDTVTQTVYIDEYFVLYVPNAFSPDGDNINDEFKALGTGLTALETTIFDRWGGTIFNNVEMDKGWNGKNSKDVKVEKGIYIYKIIATNFLGEKKQFTGHVTVVR